MSSVEDMSLTPLSQTPFMQSIWLLLHSQEDILGFSSDATVVGVGLTEDVDFLFKMTGIVSFTSYGHKGGNWSFFAVMMMSINDVEYFPTKKRRPVKPQSKDNEK